ncbi:MAG: LacI family DNA-binding transcriptional regulator [Verrucomicrobiota bacterium JB022]|nr:LacI family DNA-binding transcriptional regulator [Verrucomicrobiota bacterium JB022]
MPRVTMQDVARQAGVSKNAVSLALKGDASISATTRARILAAADELGYTRNATVSELMSRLRREREPRYQATLGLLHANQDAKAASAHPTIPVYLEGVRRRARQQGYRLDSFWLHDPEIRGETLLRILRHRNIRGLLIVGMMKENRLPDHLRPVLEQTACVVTGVRTREPTLPFAAVDHHALSLRAVEKAFSLGYQRPGLVLDPVIDGLVDHRFSSGYFVGVQHLPDSQRIPPFFNVEGARQNPALFYDWLHQHQPDVLFTLYNSVARWLENVGWRVPQDIGLIQLEWRSSRPHWAGMNQHNEVVGEVAVDMLISMLHSDQVGLPDFPRASLIDSTWMDGDTVRQRG